MSKADKMFEEFGYVKDEQAHYIHKELHDKYKKTKSVEFLRVGKSHKVVQVVYDGDLITLNAELVLCICEKMKELGWIK